MPVSEVETFDFSRVDRVLEKYDCDKSWLVMILQDTQTEYNWLPKPALERVAGRLGVPLSQVFNVATFYASFSLVERGKHIIKVCDGTACHLRGSTWIYDELCRKLGVKEGETTADKAFTLETVACLGACALAPVMSVGSKVYGHMSPDRIKQVLAAYRNGDGVAAVPAGEPEAAPAPKAAAKPMQAAKPKAAPRTKAADKPKAPPKKGRGKPKS
jgi:NADH-quinone oxidoreductase subunit E